MKWLQKNYSTYVGYTKECSIYQKSFNSASIQDGDGEYVPLLLRNGRSLRLFRQCVMTSAPCFRAHVSISGKGPGILVLRVLQLTHLSLSSLCCRTMIASKVFVRFRGLCTAVL